jgi:hypothetical protein
MGSGLSPNGLPFSQEGIVSLSLLDKIKHLDLQRNRVTVEAGARIQPVSFVLCHSGLKLLLAWLLMVSASIAVSILCTKGFIIW